MTEAIVSGQYDGRLHLHVSYTLDWVVLHRHTLSHTHWTDHCVTDCIVCSGLMTSPWSVSFRSKSPCELNSILPTKRHVTITERDSGLSLTSHRVAAPCISGLCTQSTTWSPIRYDTIEEFNVYSKAEKQLNLAHVARN